MDIATVACFNTLRPRPNGRHLPGDIFKFILFNENVWISIKISLKFVPKVRINNIPAFVQIMAWHRPGDKPLSAPMMVTLYRRIYESLGLNELNLNGAHKPPLPYRWCNGWYHIVLLCWVLHVSAVHYSDVIMSAMASQITSLSIACPPPPVVQLMNENLIYRRQFWLLSTKVVTQFPLYQASQIKSSDTMRLRSTLT